jgi:mono/diheme cytochrome c family protein
MKKVILFSILPVLAMFLFIAAYQPTPTPDDLDLGWPEEVMTVLEQTCFDCHTSESGNVKAKGKLNFSKWEEYKLTKKVGKLDGIKETVGAGDMPPKKYLNKYPDKALTEEEIKMIADWANAEADKLIGE